MLPASCPILLVVVFLLGLWSSAPPGLVLRSRLTPLLVVLFVVDCCQDDLLFLLRAVDSAVAVHALSHTHTCLLARL